MPEIEKRKPGAKRRLAYELADGQKLVVPSIVICHCLNISGQSLRQHQHHGIIPVSEEPNQYPLIATISAYCKWLQARFKSANKEFADGRAKYQAAKAAQAELRLARESGELCYVKDVVEYSAELLGPMRTRALAIPARAAAQWSQFKSAADLNEWLKNEIAAYLNGLAKIDFAALGAARERAKSAADLDREDPSSSEDDFGL